MQPSAWLCYWLFTSHMLFVQDNMLEPPQLLGKVARLLQSACMSAWKIR